MTAAERARELVALHRETGAGWCTEADFERLLAIAAAGLVLRETLATPLPGTPVDVAMGLDGWRVAMASDIAKFDAAIAQAVGEGGEG